MPMVMIQIHSELLEFIRLLNLARVRYLLVGGYAVGYHGYDRPTPNFDLWVRTDRVNAQHVVQALERFGFVHAVFSSILFQQKNRIISVGNPPLMIQIHTTLTGIDFDESWQSRVRQRLYGANVNIICLKQLRANKTATGRLKDLADLESLPPK